MLEPDASKSPNLGASLLGTNLLGDRYEVIRELGRGGMGVVYACIDRVTGLRVALKRVDRPGRSGSTETFWFHQEARALASLEHPAIVRARDFGVLADGSPFLVMELIAGKSLQQLLDARPLAWPDTWSIIDQALAALAHAHARGVVHGDLKPQNLLVQGAGTGSQTDPRVHMLDFGLAFLLQDRRDPRLDNAARPAVAMPSGGGTPGFMAPEQIRRAVPHVGPPTDLYALGCILFQMLTGNAPYLATRTTAQGVMEADEEQLLILHKRAAVPRPTLPEGVPDVVADYVVRMLAKRPWRRFDFAGELRILWERVRPTGLRGLRPEPATEAEFDALSSGPDTRVDVLSHAGGGLAKAPLSLPVTSEGAAPELLGLRATPLVGRVFERAELDRLTQLMANPDGPHKRMVLLSGEAGVGKSRIAEWLCELVHENARMVPLRARYRRVNGPLDGLNGAVLSHYGLERVDRILVEQALINTWEIDKDDEEGLTWVAATAEWLRPSATTFRADDTSEVSRERRRRERSILGPTGKRFSLDEPEIRWLVVRKVFERISKKRPILLFADDVHLCPAATLAGLDKMRREAPELRLLIVATARDEGLVADPITERRLVHLLHVYGGPRMEIAPLHPVETHALLRAALPIDDQALHAAEQRSRGNPLFALQLLHSWASSGAVKLVGGTYEVHEDALRGRATTTGDLWDERLRALPKAHCEAAEAAAALGMECRGDVLRRLVGHVVGIGGFGADVARALDALQRAHILVGSGEDRFRFPHALLQEHLLHRLGQASRGPEIFRFAAEALSQHPLAGTRRVVRHRALNLLRARRGDDAAHLLLEVVEDAWSRVRDASRTLEDLALLEEVVDVTGEKPALSVDVEGQHLRWRAEALRHAGRFEEAREDAQRARKVFATQGHDRDEAHCLRLLGHIASEQGTPEEGRKLVSRALAMFDREEDDRGRASCEVVLGEVDYLLGDHRSARDALHRGARRFRTLGDPLGRAQCLLLLGLIEVAEGNIAKAKDLLNESRADFDSIGYRLGISQCDLAIAHAEHRGGDLVAARDRALKAQIALRVLENPRGLAGTSRLLAFIAIDEGDVPTAERHGRQALDLFEKLGDPWGILESRLALVQSTLLRGALDEARLELEVCQTIEVAEAEPQQHRFLTEAWLALAQGFPRKAASALEQAQGVFRDLRRCGDHTAQIVARLAVLPAREPATAILVEWATALTGRGLGQLARERLVSAESETAEAASGKFMSGEFTPLASGELLEELPDSLPKTKEPT